MCTLEKILNGAGMLMGIIGTLIMFIGTPKIMIGSVIFGGSQKPKEDKAKRLGRLGLAFLCLGFILQLISLFV